MKKKPVVLIVMDGIGLSEKTDGNAVRNAYTPILDKMWATCPHTCIAAHGVAVGLPTDGDMGNSEVGHNALGCGQIYSEELNWLMNQLLQMKYINQKFGLL